MSDAGRALALHLAVLAALAALPLVLPPYHLTNLARILVLAVFATGYNLAFGYTGLLSLGHALFFAAGLYATGLLVERADLPAGPALLAGVAAGGLAAAAVGLLALRTTGTAFMIVTLMFAQAGYLTVLYFGALTRGDEGFVIARQARAIGPLDLSADLPRYFAALALFAAALLGTLALVQSRTGRVLVAMRENAERSRMLGYDPFRYRLLALALSGLLAGASGAAYGLLFGYVGATFASIQYSILPLLWVLLGGAGTVLGPLHRHRADVLPRRPRLRRHPGAPARRRHRAARARALRAARACSAACGKGRCRGCPDRGPRAHPPLRRPARRRPRRPRPRRGRRARADRPERRRQDHPRRPDLRPPRPLRRPASASRGRTSPACPPTPGCAAASPTPSRSPRSSPASAPSTTSRSRSTPPGDLRAQALAALARVGLAERAGQAAGTLAYGHQRLLEIAMGLALEPKLLILDEPTQGLAAGEIAGFKALVRGIAATVLLIEHNMDVVMDLADRITVLNFGQVLATGTPAAIRADPAVQAAYLGA